MGKSSMYRKETVPTRSLEWPRLFDHCSNCTQWQCEDRPHLIYSTAVQMQCMKRAASGGGHVREVLCSKRDSDYIGVQAINNRYLLRSLYLSLKKKQDCNVQKFYISKLLFGVPISNFGNSGIKKKPQS